MGSSGCTSSTDSDSDFGSAGDVCAGALEDSGFGSSTVSEALGTAGAEIELGCSSGAVESLELASGVAPAHPASSAPAQNISDANNAALDLDMGPLFQSG